ncbi:MAG: hypothetical protein K2K87_03355 [Lachnospiraceae bacterium]|nr:hypothetical protein [Lachnospiraceae bacterium]
MLSVTHNLSAMNSSRQFGIVNKKSNKLTEKLSSGYKINRAADDAAGLTISEKMRHQIRGLHQAADNIMDGISYVQTAEGALNEVSDMLQRVNDLAIKSANGTNTAADREAIDHEVQALKSEMQRVFKSTTFNEKQIWPDQPKYFKQVGTYPVQAVKINNTENTFSVTNSNYDVLAYGSYKINADKNGVNVSWMGYDGNKYKTTAVSWDTLKKNNYSFEMSDYFGGAAADGSNKLYDAAGKPAFKHTISFAPVSSATVDDMIQSINGTTFSQYLSAYMSGNFENAAGSNTASGMYVYTQSLSYAAAVASRTNGTNVPPHTFDGTDDNWFVPSKSSTANEAVTSSNGNLTSKPAAATVQDAKASSDGWTFSYYIDGIGTVQAKSTSVSYWAGSETNADDEGIWWEWHNDGRGGRYKYAIERTTGPGTLGDVMKTLTGDKTPANPGLLTSANKGASETGGMIELHFSLTADNEFTYADAKTSKHVGSFSLALRVENTDTEDSVLTKIRNALTDQTILDFASASATSDYSEIRSASAKKHIIDVPIYEGTHYFDVHAGTAADQFIGIKYDSLRLHLLGMEDTNVLTIESSRSAIDEVKSAIALISGQRGDFGAYQNRLEHAYNIDKISEENTQRSESVIRDTDMAKTMVEHSLTSILQQSGISMMAQANRTPESVLRLLQ